MTDCVTTGAAVSLIKSKSKLVTQGRNCNSSTQETGEIYGYQNKGMYLANNNN